MSENVPADGRMRIERGRLGRCTDIVAALLTLLGLAWALDLQRLVGLVVYNEQFMALMLALALAVVFMRAGEGRAAGPMMALNLAGAAAGAGICAWLAVAYPELLFAMVQDPALPVVIGAALLVLLLIAVYRVAGLFLALVLVAFLALALFGDALPADVQGRSVSMTRLLAYIAVDPTATLGQPLLVTCTIVIAFIFFGMLIVAFGGSDVFTHLAVAGVGRTRGGGAKVAVVGSGLFGSVSGSAVANVVATGVITIPLMRAGGYAPRVAAAIEAVASTGGQLLPPIMGAAAFLMAEFLQVSYGEVLLAALLPAILYYLALFIYTDLIAGRDRIEAVAPTGTPPGRVLALRAIPFVLPFVALVAALFMFNRTPQNSALIGAGLLLVLCALARSRPLGDFPRLFAGALVQTGQAIVEIIIIAAVAGVIIGILNLTGAGFALSLLLLKVGAGSLVLVLVITALVSIILGMGMPTVGVYVLLATLAAPALVELGVQPIAAHLFVLYFGMMSMITPPVAIAAFAAATMARARPMATALEAMRVGWAAYIVPFLFVFSPALLLQGSLIDIAIAFVTAVVGVWLITAAVVGFARAPLSPLRRVIFATVGIALLMPADTFGGAWLTDIVGIAGVVILLFADRALSRRATAPTPVQDDGP